MLRLVYLHVEDLLLPVVCYILNKDHHHNQSVDHNVNKHTKTHIHVYVCIKQNKLDRVCPLFDLESTTPNARLKTRNIINNLSYQVNWLFALILANVKIMVFVL